MRRQEREKRNQTQSVAPLMCTYKNRAFAFGWSQNKVKKHIISSFALVDTIRSLIESQLFNTTSAAFWYKSNRPSRQSHSTCSSCLKCQNETVVMEIKKTKQNKLQSKSVAMLHYLQTSDGNRFFTDHKREGIILQHWCMTLLIMNFVFCVLFCILNVQYINTDWIKLEEFPN